MTIQKICFTVGCFLGFASAFGDVRFDAENTACVLRKNVNKVWSNAAAEELSGKVFPKATPLGEKRAGVKVGDTWYGAKAECFVDSAKASGPMTTEALPGGEEKLASERQKPREEHISPSSSSSDSTGVHSGMHVELMAGLALIQSSGAKASTSTDSSTGVTTTNQKAKSKGDFGLRIGYDLRASSFFGRVTRTSLNQPGTFSGTLSGAGAIQESFTQIAAGYNYSFGTGTFRPYLGGAIGFSSFSYTTVLSGFSTAGFNGTVQGSGSGLYYAPEFGGLWSFGSFAIVPSVRYDITQIKKEKVTASTSTLYSSGTESTVESADQYKAIFIGLGVRYQF